MTDSSSPMAWYTIQLITINLFCILVNNRKQAGSAPLMTRAMREVRQEAEMYKYDKVGTFMRIRLLKAFRVNHRDKIVLNIPHVKTSQCQNYNKDNF